MVVLGRGMGCGPRVVLVAAEQFDHASATTAIVTYFGVWGSGFGVRICDHCDVTTWYVVRGSGFGLGGLGSGIQDLGFRVSDL